MASSTPPLVYVIPLMILVITSVSSQQLPEVPFPIKVVPLNQIPPGFTKLTPDPPLKSTVLEDKQLPGLVKRLILTPLPNGYILAIPTEAGASGYTTKVIPDSPESITVPVNNVPQGFRPIPPPPLGQVNIFRTPALGQIGVVNPPAPPGMTLAFSLRPPQGMTLGPEFMTPFVPPPLQIIPQNSPIPPGMMPVPNAPPNSINIDADAGNPKVRAIIPNVPQNLRLVAPQFGSVTVKTINAPGGFEIVDQNKIPFGKAALPVPDLEESLVIKDSFEPGVMTLVPRAPPGYANVMPITLPPNIRWSVIKSSEHRGPVQQAVPQVQVNPIPQVVQAKPAQQVVQPKPVQQIVQAVPQVVQAKPVVQAAQPIQPIPQVAEVRPIEAKPVVQTVPDLDIKALLAKFFPKPDVITTTTTTTTTTTKAPAIIKAPAVDNDFDINAFIANLGKHIPKTTTTKKTTTTTTTTKKPTTTTKKTTTTSTTTVKTTTTSTSTTTKRPPDLKKIVNELFDSELERITQEQLDKAKANTQDNSINENIVQNAYNSQPQENTAALTSLQVPAAVVAPLETSAIDNYDQGVGYQAPENSAIDNYDQGGGYQQPQQQIDTVGGFDNTGQDYLAGYNSVDNSNMEQLSNNVVDDQYGTGGEETDFNEGVVQDGEVASEERVMEMIKKDAELKKRGKFSNKKTLKAGGISLGSGHSQIILGILVVFCM